MTDPSKIKASHTARQAFIYVRQSSASQVEHNRESTARQYALGDKAQQLGWPKDQVTIVDDDLGLSGASADNVVVYYVIALALYMRSSYREVLRCLLEGVQWLLAPSATVKVAGKSGISQARSRLGPEPLQKLYEALVAPIAEKRTKGAWYREWRLISLDGSTLDTADTAENEKAFGRPGASRGSSAFPKIRFVALLENGTHILWAARMSKYRTDEITLAQEVVPALRKGMLCLADRFFPGYKLWRMAARTGADLLWRTRQNARLDVDQRLPDGSYLSRIYASTSDRRNQRKGIVVRVIDYRLKDVKDAEPIYRLITTILDPTQAPAKELAALYHERWEIETALDELKTHLRGAQIVLRSKTPELVKQDAMGACPLTRTNTLGDTPVRSADRSASRSGDSTRIEVSSWCTTFPCAAWRISSSTAG
jgi:hypothetical protein